MTTRDLIPSGTSRRNGLRARLVYLFVLVVCIFMIRSVGLLLFGALCAPFVLGYYVFKGVLVPLTVGNSCPACGERALAYVGCISFGYRYHRCAACGNQFKRRDTLEPWEEASDPEDVEFYRGKQKSVTWSGELWRASVAISCLLVLFLGSALGYWIGGDRGIPVGFLLGWGVGSLLDRMWLASPKNRSRGVWDRDLDS